jgi:hypothetical protein
MPHLVLELHPADGPTPCACCGDRPVSSDGPRLARADTLESVCYECGKKHDPPLAALLELACVAQRVGTIGRHHVSPPMTALLDLARAAENYTCAALTH